MTIYVCGDSTAASYAPARAPITGWGQVLCEMTDGVPVENRAMGGRSTKSFLSEGRLVDIEEALNPGDLMLIQFTHNDISDLVWRHTDPWTSFQENLAIYVQTARERGAMPVLLTPICRRYFRNGALIPSHDEYPDAIRALALRLNVPLIDMYEKSVAHVSAMGDEESKKLYMHFGAGLYDEFPDGQADDTHTQRAGALCYARMVADGLRALHLIPPSAGEGRA